jgi:hypothetical protein
MTDAKPKRRRFRFSLRTLFVLVTIVGVWLGFQLNWIRERHEFLRRPAVSEDSSILDDSACPTKAPWELRLFGEPPIKVIVVPSAMTEEAGRLFPESLVAIARASI